MESMQTIRKTFDVLGTQAKTGMILPLDCAGRTTLARAFGVRSSVCTGVVTIPASPVFRCGAEQEELIQ